MCHINKKECHSHALSTFKRRTYFTKQIIKINVQQTNKWNILNLLGLLRRGRCKGAGREQKGFVDVEEMYHCEFLEKICVIHRSLFLMVLIKFRMIVKSKGVKICRRTHMGNLSFCCGTTGSVRVTETFNKCEWRCCTIIHLLADINSVHWQQKMVC